MEAVGAQDAAELEKLLGTHVFALLHEAPRASSDVSSLGQDGAKEPLNGGADHGNVAGDK